MSLGLGIDFKLFLSLELVRVRGNLKVEIWARFVAGVVLIMRLVLKVGSYLRLELVADQISIRDIKLL